MMEISQISDKARIESRYIIAHQCQQMSANHDLRLSIHFRN